jgi:hypothetical protein
MEMSMKLIPVVFGLVKTTIGPITHNGDNLETTAECELETVEYTDSLFNRIKFALRVVFRV